MLLSELRRRTVRSIMTAAAVAISVTMLLTMLSFAEGLQARVMGDIEGSREDILISAGNPETNIQTLTGIVDGHGVPARIEGFDGVAEAAPYLFQPVLCSPNSTSEGRMIACLGIVPERSEPFLNEERSLVLGDLAVEFKDWFDTHDDPHFAGGDYDGPWTGEMLIDPAAAHNLGLRVGEPAKVTPLGGGRTGSFIVTGFFDDGLTGEGLSSEYIKGAAIIHLSELQSLTGILSTEDAGGGNGTEGGEGVGGEGAGGEGAGGDGSSGADGGGGNSSAEAGDPLDVFTGGDPAGPNVKVEDSITGISVMVGNSGNSRSVDAVAEKLKDEFPFYWVITKEDRTSLLNERVAWARVVYIITGSVCLIIGLLFVATIMLMSVYERTVELGMMRAIGISRRTIFTQVLAQSLILILIGCTVGAIMGYFSTIMMSNWVGAQYGLSEQLAVYSPVMVVQSIVLVLFFGLVFSLYPSWRAVKVDVVKALKHVQ